MPDSVLANYSFLPWVRQGLGNEIMEADSLGNALPNNPAMERPEIEITTKVKASKGEIEHVHTIQKTVKVQGPGDVLGINHQSIIRTNPKKGVMNFETNNLCYIEFYEEDLPWRFTPAKPVGEKLRPWLTLIVLKENEFEKSTGGTPTPFINIASEALSKVFCHEKDIYSLAHVHVMEDLGDNSGNTASQLSAKLKKNPDLALSRVLSARKLEYTSPDPSLDFDPNVYHAFLIPSFETGRLAGLQLPTADIPAQMSSWSKSAINSGDNPSSYPYYFTWSFKVDEGGDFESLAQLLEARELPENIGKREMDMSTMGFGIKPVDPADSIGYVEGAMKHPEYKTAPWPISDQKLKEDLLFVLNISSNLQDTLASFNDAFFYSPALSDDPIIAPPTYGRWHKGVNVLNRNSQDWVHQLNLHPSNRSAAGLGVQVVQKHQEMFMELAWEQIGEINEANQKIRESELIKRATKSLAVKKVFKLNQFDLISAAGKAFDVLKADNATETLKKTIKSSTVPTALRSGTFLKVANNFTPTALMTKDGTDGATKVLNAQFFTKLNKKEDDPEKISAAKPKKDPPVVLPTLQAYAAISFVVNNPSKSFMELLAEAILKVPNNSSFSAIKVLAKLEIDADAPLLSTKENEARIKGIKDRAEAIVKGITDHKTNVSGAKRQLTIDSDVFEERINSNFDEGIYGTGNNKVRFKKEAPAASPVLFDQNVVIQSRQDYLTNFSSKLITKTAGIAQTHLFKRPKKAVLTIDFHKNIREKLNPVLNFDRKLASFFASNFINNNKPIMAYPRFPMPTYDFLKEISPDYIIPNISEIEPNTITLMEPNNKFIESFLMGMNHEFSRELLWREYPTDMRGSYFRHFWEYDNDPNANVELGEDYNKYINDLLSFQNLRSDIKEIHKWNKPLGKNDMGNGPSLILLIKGDLLRKYPNTLVYAQRAKFQGNKNSQRQLDTYNQENVKWPIITGSLEPDVYFFGFELTEEEANGNRTNNPGWFFVLRERPGQVSFGLDDLDGALDTTPDNWDNVTWEHITGNVSKQPPHLKVNGVTINLSPNGNGPRAAQWGKSSSDMAYILYQSPILFARHASTMLND